MRVKPAFGPALVKPKVGGGLPKFGMPAEEQVALGAFKPGPDHSWPTHVGKCAQAFHLKFKWRLSRGKRAKRVNEPWHMLSGHIGQKRKCQVGLFGL